jgi:hypothetical protein
MGTGEVKAGRDCGHPEGALVLTAPSASPHSRCSRGVCYFNPFGSFNPKPVLNDSEVSSPEGRVYIIAPQPYMRWAREPGTMMQRIRIGGEARDGGSNLDGGSESHGQAR